MRCANLVDGQNWEYDPLERCREFWLAICHFLHQPVQHAIWESGTIVATRFAKIRRLDGPQRMEVTVQATAELLESGRISQIARS